MDVWSDTTAPVDIDPNRLVIPGGADRATFNVTVGRVDEPTDAIIIAGVSSGLTVSSDLEVLPPRDSRAGHGRSPD